MMTYQRFVGGVLDYSPCQYGDSKLVFRGPKQSLTQDYVAFLGGSATFGKAVRTPFPSLVEQELDVRAVNLGCVNAGVDTFGQDLTVQEICGRARACVVQVMGAQKLSNPYYSVHRRRNDRVLAPSEKLRKLYPEVDFTDIHFARHLVQTLEKTDAERFADVREALRETWRMRMRALIDMCPGPVVLLWLADHALSDSNNAADGPDPLFIDRDLVESIRVSRMELAEVACPSPEHATQWDGSLASMLNPKAAIGLPSPALHRRASTVVAQGLSTAFRV